MEHEVQSALETGNRKTDEDGIHAQVVMALSKFCKKFLDALNVHGVEYLVVGGQDS